MSLCSALRPLLGLFSATYLLFPCLRACHFSSLRGVVAIDASRWPRKRHTHVQRFCSCVKVVASWSALSAVVVDTSRGRCDVKLCGTHIVFHSCHAASFVTFRRYGEGMLRFGELLWSWARGFKRGHQEGIGDHFWRASGGHRGASEGIGGHRPDFSLSA